MARAAVIAIDGFDLAKHLGVALVFVVLPQFTLMRLAFRRELFGYSDWLYEVKYDGFRALA